MEYTHVHGLLAMKKFCSKVKTNGQKFASKTTAMYVKKSKARISVTGRKPHKVMRHRGSHIF
jgi:hypothetical protein